MAQRFQVRAPPRWRPPRLQPLVGVGANTGWCQHSHSSASRALSQTSPKCIARAPSQICQPAMSKDAYARFADSLVAESFNNWRTRTYDCYQKCCLGIL
eukprot:6475737-Prymnesium_polylepis.1